MINKEFKIQIKLNRRVENSIELYLHMEFSFDKKKTEHFKLATIFLKRISTMSGFGVNLSIIYF